ncbi:NADPH:quinone oxidoreductase family protein [Erythrobacter sp. R86502]|uniref:NADPH:quinone oxidoreductase family protein n=1 Tax=Erythrobacter sp. R86502 TaxID=3093846 RepID=UPI0036D3B8EE
MQALRVDRLSADLSGVALIDVAVPRRAPDEVLVRIQAASLNFPDVLMTRGDYQFKPEPPFTSGLEFAGEVIDADKHSGFKLGDRVMGGNKTGAFAEFASVPASKLSLMPKGMDFPAAAAMGAAYSTAFTGLVELGGLQEGQWVLVHGASGGVGLAACDLALALGAKVIATTGSDAKKAAIAEKVHSLARPLSVITAAGRFREEVAQLTDGTLVNIVFDPVGGDIFDESTRCVAFGGKLIVVGFASGRIADVSTNIPLIKGFGIIGLRAGEYARRLPERGAAIQRAIRLLAEREAITPAIDRVLPLSRWREGFDAMTNRELVGKVVFQPG